MGSLILITLILFCGNGAPTKIMKFVIPHSVELSVLDKTILESVKDRNRIFSFCGCAAKVETVNNMVNWATIGEEI